MSKVLRRPSRKSGGNPSIACADSKSRILSGKIIELLQDARRPARSIIDAEFSVFSQWGEDGMIHYVVRHIKVSSKVFLEFGVENYQQANTRWLLEGHNWSKVILDGEQANIRKIQAEPLYWRHDLTVVCAFIDAENINSLIRDNGLSGDIGLLSVDIDDMDYWV